MSWGGGPIHPGFRRYVAQHVPQAIALPDQAVLENVALPAQFGAPNPMLAGPVPVYQPHPVPLPPPPTGQPLTPAQIAALQQAAALEVAARNAALHPNLGMHAQMGQEDPARYPAIPSPGAGVPSNAIQGPAIPPTMGIADPRIQQRAAINAPVPLTQDQRFAIEERGRQLNAYLANQQAQQNMAAVREAADAGQMGNDPLVQHVIEPSIAALDKPRQIVGRRVGGEALYRIATNQDVTKVLGLLHAIPGVGPISAEVLHQMVNFYGGPDAIKQAYQQGGPVGVWENVIAARGDTMPTPLRLLYHAVTDTGFDPLTYLGTLGKAGELAQGAAIAGKAARGAETASLGERALMGAGRLAEVPDLLLNKSVDALFEGAGAGVRGVGRGLFDLTRGSKIAKIAEEEVEPVLENIQRAAERARNGPPLTNAVTDTDYFGPGGSLAPDTTLALPEPPLITPPPGSDLVPPTRPESPAGVPEPPTPQVSQVPTPETAAAPTTPEATIPEPTVAQVPEAETVPAPTPEPAAPPAPATGLDWLDKLRGMTPEQRTANIKAGRISAWTPMENGDRLIDRAYFRLGDQYPERRAAFDAEVAGPTQRTVAIQRRVEKEYFRDGYGGIQSKHAALALNGVEHTVDVVAPAYERHFGDLDPVNGFPLTTERVEVKKTLPTDSGKAKYGKENGAYLVERAVYDPDEKKAESIIRYFQSTIGKDPNQPDFISRLQLVRQRAQQFVRERQVARGQRLLEEAPPVAEAAPAESLVTPPPSAAPETTAAEAAPTEPGTLFPLPEAQPTRTFTPPEPIAADDKRIVAKPKPTALGADKSGETHIVFRERDYNSILEATSGRPQYVDSQPLAIIRKETPARMTGKPWTVIDAEDGSVYGAFPTKAKATQAGRQLASQKSTATYEQFARDQFEQAPARSAAAADFALTPESAHDQTVAAFREAGDLAKQGLDRALPDVPNPAVSEVPRPSVASLDHPAIDMLEQTGVVTPEESTLLATPVTIDERLFRSIKGGPKLQKKITKVTAGGTKLTMERSRETSLLGLLTDLREAGFDDQQMSRIAAEAVGIARGTIERENPASWLRTSPEGRALRNVVKGLDSYNAAVRDLIQYNVMNAGRGFLLDSVSDGFKMAMHGHWKPVAQSLSKGYVGTVFGSIRGNDPEAFRALWKDVDDLGIMMKPRSVVDRSRFNTGASEITAVERLEDALHAPRSLSYVFASSLYKDFRQAGDETRRMAVYAEVVRREHPQALERFMRTLKAHAAKQGIEPETWTDAIRAEAKASGKTEDVFDSADVFRATADTELSKAWKRELNGMRTKAYQEQEKLFYTYRSTNADAALRRTVYFHYWMSREVALHAQMTLKNPALLASYYRLWNGWQKVAEDEGYPDSVKGMFGYMANTWGGWASVISPMAALVPWTMFSDVNDQDKSFFDKIGLFFTPLLQGAAAVAGLTDRVPDLTGTYAVRGFIRTVADYGAAHGLDFMSRFGGAEGFVDHWERRVFEKLNDYATGWDLPGVKQFSPWNPDSSQTDMLRSVVLANAQAQGIPATDPRVLDAFESIQTGDYDANPLSAQAYKEYADHRLFGKLVGLFIPNSVRNTARDQAIAGNAAFSEQYGAGQPITDEAAAAHQARDLATASDPALSAAANEYANLGTERQRNLANGWREVAYDTDGWDGHTLTIGSMTIQGPDLVQMSETDRKRLADMWVAQYEGTDELAAYRDLQDQYVQAHPELADYKTYQSTVHGYEGGPAAFRRNVAQTHPQFARALKEAKARYESYGETGPVLENDLDRWAASVDGYQAFRGQRSNIYDDRPLPAYNPAQDAYAGLGPGASQTGGSGGGSGGGSSSTADKLQADITDYETKAAYMQQVVGVDLTQFTGNPIAESYLQQTYGDLMPQATRLMNLYQQWTLYQPPGVDTSVQAFGRYMDQLTMQARLGLSPGAAATLTNNARGYATP